MFMDSDKIGTLVDPRVISLGKEITCPKCNRSTEDEKNGKKGCYGHSGQVIKNDPLFHIFTIKYVLQVLQAVCFNCSKILTQEKVESSFGKNMLKKYAFLGESTKECLYCNFIQPKYQINKCTILKNSETFQADEAFRIIKISQMKIRSVLDLNLKSILNIF